MKKKRCEFQDEESTRKKDIFSDTMLMFLLFTHDSTTPGFNFFIL